MAGSTSSAGNTTYTAAAGTLNSNDVIADSSGTDTLNIAFATTAAVTPVVVGVEAINANYTTFAAPTFGADNVTGGVITVNQLQAGGSTNATVQNLGATTTAKAGTGITGTLSVSLKTASTTVTIDAGDATGVTLTATNNVATEVADGANITGKGTIALDTDGAANNQVVEVLNLSGSTAAVTYDIADASTAANTVKGITLSGSQNVTVILSSAAAAGQTITDSTTAGTTTLTIDTVGAVDLSKASVDLVNVNAAVTGTTTTFRNGQAAKLSTANAGAWTLDINDQTTTNVSGSLSLELGVVSANNIVLDATGSSDNITALTVKNDTIAQTGLKLLAGTAAAVTLTGSKDVVLDTTATAKSVDASGFTGNLTVNYDNTSDIATVTGGSGADNFTNAGTAIGTQVTINGGAGNDTFTMLTAAKAVIDGGDGTADKVVLAGTNNAKNLTLSNIEVIALTGTGIADFKASQLSGKTFAIAGDATADTIQINDALAIDTTTIDLSKLVIDTTNVTKIIVDGTAKSGDYGTNAAITFTGSSTGDDFTGDAGADTISTGAGADTVVGAAGADSITGGEGGDHITGGAGADTIILTETTSAVDNVVYAALTEGSAAGAAAGTFSGYDVITGFTLAKDQIVFDAAYANDGAVTTANVDAAFVVASDAAATAANDLTTAADFLNVDKVVLFLNDLSKDYTATLDGTVVAVTFGTGTYIYAVSGSADAAAAAAEVTLIGTVDAVLTTTELVI